MHERNPVPHLDQSGSTGRKGVYNMEYVTGVSKKETVEISEILSGDFEGKQVKVNGAVHTIRDMGEVAFVILRKREGLLQCVFEEGKTKFDLKELKEASTIEVEGTVRAEHRAPNGFEVRLDTIRVLSEPAEQLPFAISKWKLPTTLETNLDHRAIALRNVRERAKFRIQEGVVRGFRDFLYSEGFTEIHTPKIGAKSAEGGANLFRLEYFHRPAVLQQSPQFYKQMMVGVFDRVFETAPVFRAEKHNTKRHLNEYTSLDFEMGYIDGFEDIMAMETGFLQYTMKLLERDYAKELKMLGVTLPNVEQIPAVRFDEAKQKVAEKYHALLTELSKNVKSAHRHGMKPQNDVLKVQVKLNESELSLRKADNALRLAGMNLCHYIGRPLTAQIDISDDFPEVEQEWKVQVSDITARPEYGILNKQIAIAEQEVKLNRSELLPRIGVRGSYDYLHGLEVNDETLMKKGAFSVFLNVSVPLFHFGERTNKVKSAKVKLEQARLEQENVNEKMLLELMQAANNLDEARLETELSERSLEQAEENMKVSGKQYEVGLETLSDYLEAQVLWQQAYQTKVDAYFQLYVNYVAYLKAAGQLQ